MRVLILLFMSFSVASQTTVKGANNNDLRTAKEVFSITWNDFEYKLESSQLGHFNLNYYKKQKLVSTWKVDSMDAQGIDDDFADKFITLKYEMAHHAEKECSSLYQLRMRGEGQTVCELEKDKIKILEKFIEDLEKKFS